MCMYAYTFYSACAVESIRVCVRARVRAKHRLKLLMKLRREFLRWRVSTLAASVARTEGPPKLPHVARLQSQDFTAMH